MDYQKLIAAAAVRDLASSIKAGKKHDYWLSISKDPNRDELRDQWDTDHPLTEYIPEALRQLQEIAELMP